MLIGLLIKGNITKNRSKRENYHIGKKYVVRGTYKPFIVERDAWIERVKADHFLIMYINYDVLTKSKINELQVFVDIHKPSLLCLTEVLPKHTALL